MTDAEKEQLWNCISKMRSMPWKKPRGGTYNWTYREMRILYEKLIYYATINSIDGAWKFLTTGKYSYMIYPWYRLQLIQCTAFSPTVNCVFESTFSFVDLNYSSFIYGGTVKIQDVDTLTVLGSGNWLDAVFAVQSTYDVWGYISSEGTNQFTFHLFYKGVQAPNWQVMLDNGVDPPSVFPFVFDAGTCSFNLIGYKLNYAYSINGGTSPSDFTFRSSLTNELKNVFTPSPFVLSAYNSFKKYLTATNGKDININFSDDAGGNLYTVICNLYQLKRIALFSVTNNSTLITSNTFGDGPTQLCDGCYFMYSSNFYISVGSGQTIVSSEVSLNGLPADDPNTYYQIAAFYGGFAYAYTSVVVLSFAIVLPTDYISLPTFSITNPGGLTIVPISYSQIAPDCAKSCIEVVIPITDTFISSLFLSNYQIYFISILGFDLDVSDIVNAQIVLDAIYKDIYGPACSAGVQLDINGDVLIKVNNVLESPILVSSYYESASSPGTFYYYSSCV